MLDTGGYNYPLMCSWYQCISTHHLLSFLHEFTHVEVSELLFSTAGSKPSLITTRETQMLLSASPVT